MSRIFDKPIEDVIRERRSVRTYDKKPLSDDVKEKLQQYICGLKNPFSCEVSFKLLKASTAVNADKLGTYGMIKGESDYIGVMVKEAELDLEAVGYAFEELILYASSLGVGTCWLGGTFNKGEFAKAMGVKEGESFPAITPIGWPAKMRAAESVVRMTVKANQRRPWHELFFQQSFSSALTKEAAGKYAFLLEMVRLAPSASNKQPWRIVVDGNTVHFYEEKAIGYSDRLGFDIQRVDLGIAACHFQLAAMEKGIAGSFQKKENPAIVSPENVFYLFSWTAG